MLLKSPVTREFLEHLVEGFQVISPDWVYLYVNPAAAAQGRSTPNALIGRRIWDVYPGFAETSVFSVMKHVMQHRVAESIEHEFIHLDGTKRWFELRLEPVPQGLCIQSIDVDERKRAQAALAALNEQLEQRVAERTHELERSNRELEAFCFSVSHDLRTPLRAIDGFASLLAEQAERLDDEGREHLHRIQAGAQRMDRLIAELLELSRMNNVEVTRKEVDLTAMAQLVASELSQHEPKRHVEWSIATNLHERCDPGLARIALENLLGNAWKFTAKTERARIEVAASDEIPGGIAVIDNGAGFDMKFGGSLFRPFRRLHREREFPGTGIGLATVLRIAEKHGGTVRARGEVGQGATFTVSFGPPPDAPAPRASKTQ